jgi:hypothetical protein
MAALGLKEMVKFLFSYLLKGFFSVSFKPKVAISKFVWKMQKKSGIMKSGLHAMPLFLLDDLLKRFFETLAHLHLCLNGKFILIYRISHINLILTTYTESLKVFMNFFKPNWIFCIQQCTFRCKCFDVSKKLFMHLFFPEEFFWLWTNFIKFLKVGLLLQKGFEPIVRQWKGKKKLSQRHVTMIFRRVQNTFQAAQKLSNSKVDSGEFVMLSKFQRLAKKCCFFLP